MLTKAQLLTNLSSLGEGSLSLEQAAETGPPCNLK